MSDNVGNVWQKFFKHRTRTLWERFPGYYRALVVETNDPLNLYRVRFKCPDMHDFDLNPEDCPWAVPSHDLGGFRAGRFSHPCIGDWVWITFERQHPFGPIWTGFANPTRRKLYTYPQVFQVSPLSVNEDGKPESRPFDYDEQYLPKDGRPMAHGWQDRYGTLDIHSSVGYFPVQHDVAPPPKDHDALQNTKFAQRQKKPEINNPDKKYSARVTKYGNMILLGDQGYYWKNEFTGDFKQDEKFETKRWKYLQRLLNEDKPSTSESGCDQRRILFMTRYGHRLEFRDVGWAQQGPLPSKSREGEFGPAATLSNEVENDQRWIKFRTKGGMLYQASDVGMDPSSDKFIKRPLIEEVGAGSEKEDIYWKDKDARWIRWISRYGYKIVIDDRGSDRTNADGRESPRANGILIKGRRSPSSGDVIKNGNPRGYYWEFNENDKANHTSWGSPLGQSIEINDRYQYMMLTAALGGKWSSKWRGIKEHEFIRKPTMKADPETRSHHLKLDHQNEYIRLKTRGNKGKKPQQALNISGVGKKELNQGFEARDGMQGDGPWVELVDCQHRGMWFSKTHGLGIWRSKRKNKMYVWMDDNSKEMIMYNQSGRIIIYSKRNIQIITNSNINLQAGGSITMKAGRSIAMEANGTKFTVAKNVLTNTNILAKEVRSYFPGVRAGKGAGRPRPAGRSVPYIGVPVVPSTIEPTDRGQTFNGPFIECPIEEVEHKLK